MQVLFTHFSVTSDFRLSFHFFSFLLCLALASLSFSLSLSLCVVFSFNVFLTIFLFSSLILSLPTSSIFLSSPTFFVSLAIRSISYLEKKIVDTFQITEAIKLSRKGGSLHNNSLIFFWQFSRTLAGISNIVSSGSGMGGRFCVILLAASIERFSSLPFRFYSSTYTESITLLDSINEITHS